MSYVEVRTAEGRRWVVDQSALRLPTDLSASEEVRAAADLLLAQDTTVAVRADLIGSWLDFAHAQEGTCCTFSGPCQEHEKALAVARLVLGRESS